MRYTEYHEGVAVIKDKALHKEAMRKLAAYEDAEEAGKLILVPKPVRAELRKKDGEVSR